jgi:tripartite-type tricarboxylate transporter receptor subunit TctC
MVRRMLAFLLAGLGASAAALGGAQAVADGFGLLFTSASYTFAPNLYCDLPYDRVKSFEPIAMFGSSPSVLVVRASMPVRTVKGLVALARKRPGEVLYRSAGQQHSPASELFLYMAKIEVTQVPYEGGGPAQIALMTGEVQNSLRSCARSWPGGHS